ncbi:MAG TPA: hypothetical protein VLF94_08245 [Chlamydiales bacterium]|nr:hypothetical protein [Chlamydiales bacterium]
MLIEELKKQTRGFDLAVSAGRKRLSARTHFVHDEETIPLYENFCFAFALMRQKTAEAVTEGKELIDRLLAFQTPDGHFPTYLHDYPRAFDFQMGLKIAPILIYLLRDYAPVLGDLKHKIDTALKRILSTRPEKPFWENRYRACINEPLLDTAPLDWTQWLITAQLAGQTHFSLPYDPDLQLLTSSDIQEKSEPAPHPIEWLLAEGHYTPRLLRDHPHQLLVAPLFPLTYDPIPSTNPSFRLFWQGSTLHSLVAKTLQFDLSEEVQMGRHDLFEAALYTDVSPETQIFVEGRKATTFKLGDTITIQTPTWTISIRFELTQGAGDYCGHIFRANRPSQIANKGALQYEAYDWQIGLRTLRRPGPAQITIHVINPLGK